MVGGCKFINYRRGDLYASISDQNLLFLYHRVLRITRCTSPTMIWLVFGCVCTQCDVIASMRSDAIFVLLL